MAPKSRSLESVLLPKVESLGVPTVAQEMTN